MRVSSAFRFRQAPGRSGDVRLIVRNITTRHVQVADRIRTLMMSGNFYDNSLTDEDGKQQFIFGYTPMNADYRIGHTDGT